MNQQHLQLIKIQNKDLDYQTLKESGCRMDEVFKNRKSPRHTETNDLLKGLTGDDGTVNKRRCTFCKRTGHEESSCWSKYPEKRPKKENQENKIIPTRTRPPQAPEDATCSFCKRKGHNLEDCRTQKRAAERYSKFQEERNLLYCDHCKTRGHVLSRCRKKPEKNYEASSVPPIQHQNSA